MKLFEYQAKGLLQKFQIPVQEGFISSSAGEAYEIAGKMKGRIVVKAQVLTGGRGKAGGVRIVSSAEEARTAAGEILGMTIKGIPVRRVMLVIKEEYYAAIVLNSAEKRVECILSSEGGMEIEETAAKFPEKIYKIPLKRSMPPDVIPAGELPERMLDIIKKMFALFIENDCSLVEINPLAQGANGDLCALDAKIVIDDNALYKHPDLEELKNPEEYSTDEIEARKAGLAFVSLDGKIGCMVNGAGLAMATMDLIKYFGGEPANFLDIGGSSNPQKVVDGLKILIKNRSINAILLNIFGGITRCDDIARGLIEAEHEFRIDMPLVIRLIGTNDAEGIEILRQNGFTAFSSLADAVRAAVKL
jgi:succinyl-CoA synthetase beta subunit